MAHNLKKFIIKNLTIMKNSIFWVNALPLMNIDTFIRITKLIKVLIFLGL